MTDWPYLLGFFDNGSAVRSPDFIPEGDKPDALTVVDIPAAQNNGAVRSLIFHYFHNILAVGGAKGQNHDPAGF